MDFSSLAQLLGKNLKDSNDDIVAAKNAALQRIQSGGSPLDSSPAEDKYTNNLVGAVAGSVSPVAKYNLVEDGAAKAASEFPGLRKIMGAAPEMTSKEGMAKDVMDKVADAATNPAYGGVDMDAVKAAQQSASREADMADRFRQQLAARKAAALAAMKR